MKIVVTDALTMGKDLNFDKFKNLGTVEVYDSVYDEKSVLEITKDAQVILCNKTVITEKIIKNAKNLKYIGILATGYNTVDTECAKSLSIPVCNAGTYSTSAVAQLTIGLIIDRFSRISDYKSFTADGGWEKSDVFSPIVFPTDELNNKTLGIIGYGSIGKAVTNIALSLGMNVLVNTRSKQTDDRVRFVSMKELLKSSDIISLHCPLTDKTKELINKDTISEMKDGAYLINTSRGGVINENDLTDALNSDKLSGAAVDVLTIEPMRKDCPLKKAKNITILPHTAWTSFSARKRLMDITYNNLVSFIDGKLVNCVNK